MSFLYDALSSRGSKVTGIEYEIAELNEADAARAEVRNQSKEEGIKLLLHWQNTIFCYVVYDFQIYMSLAVYFITVHYLQNGSIIVSKGGGTPIKVITCLTSMMVFLLVFYLNESYRRYNAQHLCQCKLRTKINAISLLICSKSSKGETGKLKSGQIMRYLNAAQVIGYTSVTESYTEENFCWVVIRHYNLLTENEIQCLSNVAIDHSSMAVKYSRKYSAISKSSKSSKAERSITKAYIQGAAFRKVLVWVADNVIDMLANKELDDKDRGFVLGSISSLSDVMNELFDYQYLNVPFCYANVLAWFIFFYSPLFAFAVATTTVSQSGTKTITFISYDTDVYYGMFIIIFSNTFINGLYLLARMLQDPFGKDSVDLSVNDYVNLCINASNIMVNDMGTSPTFDMQTELSLKNRALDEPNEPIRVHINTPYITPAFTPAVSDKDLGHSDV